MENSLKKLVALFVKYKILANILIAITVIFGLISLLNTNLSFFPESKPRNISIQVTYPGASPQEMEEGVTLKVEEAIHNIVGIDEIISTSSENFATINIVTLKGYDIDEIYTEIKNAVDRINSFPQGAERPIIFKQKPQTTAQWLGLTGDVDLFTLKRMAEDVEDDLLASGLISQVTIVGFPELEISINVSEANLVRYGLTFDDVSQAVRNTNRDISAGLIKTESEEVLIRSRAKQTEAQSIGEIIIRSNPDGSNLRVRDVAEVKEQFAEVPNRWTLNGEQAVFIRVDKLAEEDLLAISKFVVNYQQDFNSRQSAVKLDVTYDFMDMLWQRLTMLFWNGGAGLLLVLISLGLFLSLRLSAWVAWGIPSSFLGMFIFGSFIGITINMISLFGMILVVGILVDDGIVIAENIYSHFEKGKNPYQAAVDGTVEVMPAVFVSVTTTIVAFTPLLLLEGGFEFLFDMAVVVIASLAFSLIEAFLVLPAHLGSPHVLRSKKKANAVRKFMDKWISFVRDKVYGRALQFTMRYRLISLAFLMGLFPVIFGLVAGGVIKSTFFPNIPFSGFSVDIVMKSGTPEQKTENYLKRFESQIWELNQELKEKYSEEEDIIDYTFGGLGNTSDGSESGGHAGTVQVFHRELDGDPIDGFELVEAVRQKIGKVPEAEKLTIGGFMRFGKPVAVRLLGKDLEELNAAKNFLKSELSNIPELKEVKDDIAVGKRELEIDLSQQAYFLGLTHNEITKQIRQGFFGEEVQRLQKGSDEVKVWVRYPGSGRVSIGQLERMKVKNYNNNTEYPINELINYKIERGVSSIRHYRTIKAVTVDADLVDPYAEVPPILEQVNNEIIPRLLAQYPGVKIDLGGQSRESSRAQAEIGTYFGIAFLVIFILIILAFKSFYQAVLVMIMIPLAWLGAVLGHGIQGIPISLLSAWGLVALSGVIINDAVVFLDRFNRNLKEGQHLHEASYQAGIARFRPIVLTSITTVLGLMPLLLEKSFQAQFLIPMAASIAYGVLIGTFIILMFFPVMIVIFNDIRRAAKWLWTGKKPDADSVERVVIDLQKEHMFDDPVEVLDGEDNGETETVKV